MNSEKQISELMKQVWDLIEKNQSLKREIAKSASERIEEKKILDAIDDHRVQIILNSGCRHDEEGDKMDLPWRAFCGGIMGPPCANVREAVISLIGSKKDEE